MAATVLKAVVCSADRWFGGPKTRADHDCSSFADQPPSSHSPCYSLPLRGSSQLRSPPAAAYLSSTTIILPLLSLRMSI